MTSAARTNNFRRGFTLLEIVMVLAIAAIITGGAVGLMVFSSAERELRDTGGKIEVFAKRARTISILQQTPYALEFLPGKIRLLPLAEAGSDRKTTALGNSIGGREVLEDTPKGRQPVRDELSLPNHMGTSLRRWNSDAWVPLAQGKPQIWRFDPDGLSEPVSIRLVVDQGWLEDTYHPLTATVRDTAMEVR
jgi:prepilin-type N-terminal cleavage/methylation domain-containing protein